MRIAAEEPIGRGRLGGMTLVEILAAVLILGLGVIMVTAAFPVGMRQSQEMVRDTRGGEAGRAAMAELIGSDVIGDLSSQSFNRTDGYTHITEGPKSRYIWNPRRLAWVADWDESEMWPPQPGDYIWQAFVARVPADPKGIRGGIHEYGGTEEPFPPWSGPSDGPVPLFRTTVVIVELDDDEPEFFDTKSAVAPQSRPLEIRTVRVTDVQEQAGSHVYAELRALRWDLYGGPFTYEGTGTPSLAQDTLVRPGDYIMNPLTAHCYEVIEAEKERISVRNYGPDLEAQWLPMHAPQFEEAVDSNRRWPVFRRVVGVYSQLLSN